MFGGNMETMIIKWSLGSAFVFITLVFAGKIIVLFKVFAGAQIAMLFDWITSGEFIKDAGAWLWEVVKFTADKVNPFGR